MKRTSTIMVVFLTIALMASMVPMVDAGIPAVGTNATIGTVTPGDVNYTAVPAYINFTADITGLTNETPYINLTGQEYQMLFNTTNNNYYYNWTTGITEGIFTYWVVVRDNATTNSTGKSANYTILIDATGPVITGPSSVVEGNPVTLSITDAVSGVKNATVLVYKDGNSTAYFGNLTATNGVIDASADVGVGVYTYTIYAEDVFGNSATANGTFEVTADTAAPVISDIMAEPATVPEGGYVVISANVTDAGVGVDEVMVNITRPDGGFYNESMTADGDTYSLNATYTDIGTYTFFIWAMDLNGNAVKSDEGSFEVTDATAPVINEVRAEPLGSVRVIIFANVTDNYDADGTLDMSVTILSGNIAVVDSAAMSYNTTTGLYYYITDALDIGNYTFTVYAEDAAGNMANATGAFVIADSIAPVISNINYPSSITEHDDVTITCVVTDNVDSAENLTVVINLDGSNHDMVYNNESNVFEYTIMDVTFGEHTFTISATDMAGNTAESEAETFMAADTENPELDESNTTIPTEATLGEDITFTVSLQDDDPLTVTLYYSVDGGNETEVTMTQDANGYYVATIKVDSGSELTYRIVADDGDGEPTQVAQGTITLSEKSTMSTAMLAGIGILLLVIIIAVVMMMKKKPAEAPAEEEASEEAPEEEEETESEEDMADEEEDLGEDL